MESKLPKNSIEKFVKRNPEFAEAYVDGNKITSNTETESQQTNNIINEEPAEPPVNAPLETNNGFTTENENPKEKIANKETGESLLKEFQTQEKKVIAKKNQINLNSNTDGEESSNNGINLLKEFQNEEQKDIAKKNQINLNSNTDGE